MLNDLNCHKYGIVLIDKGAEIRVYKSLPTRQQAQYIITNFQHYNPLPTLKTNYQPPTTSSCLTTSQLVCLPFPSFPLNLTHHTNRFQSTTVSARTASPTVASALASSPTARSTPPRLASRAAPPAVAETLMIAAAQATRAARRVSSPMARSIPLRRVRRVDRLRTRKEMKRNEESTKEFVTTT